MHISSTNSQFKGQRVVLYLDDVRISAKPVMETGSTGKTMKRTEIISDDPYVVNYKSFFTDKASQHHNLFDNSSFETGLKNWEVQGNCEYSVAKGNAPHGTQCLKISLKGSDAVINSRPMPVTGGEDYTLSFYAKSDRNCSIKAGGKSFQPTAEWQRFTVPLNKIKASEQGLYSIKIIASGKGNIQLDALQLEKGNLTNYKLPESVETGLSSGKKDNIFYPGESITFDLNIFNGTNQAIATDIKYNVADYRKKIIASESFKISLTPGEGNKKTLTLNLPNGYYKINATIDGMQKTEEASFAVITPVSNDRAGEDAFFGISAFTPDILSCKLFAKEAGAKYATIYNTLYWRDASKDLQQNNAQWKAADAKLEEMKEAGIIPVMGLWGIPRWTGASNVIPQSPEEVTDEIIKSWYEYTYETVKRYKDRVKYWEPWPEFMRAPLDTRASMYIKFQKAASEAIRKADPEAVIIGFGEDTARKEGSTWSLIPQLEAHFKLGSLNYVDAVGLDCYTYPASPESMEFGKMLDVLKETIRKYNNGKDKDIWVTEVGWKGIDTLYADLPYAEGSSYPAFVTELEQAEDIVRMNIIAKARGVKKFLTFPGGLASITKESPYGLVNYNGSSPKCAYAAYSHMVNCLINAKFERKIRTGDKILCYEFSSGNKTIVTIWNYDSSHKPLTLKIPVSDKNETSATNMVGTPISFPEDERWELTGSPVYFTARDKESAEKLISALEKAEIEEVVLNTYWDKEGLVVSLKNKTSNDWEGRITIEKPKGWKAQPDVCDCTIPRGQEKLLKFSFSTAEHDQLNDKLIVKAQEKDGNTLLQEIRPIFCQYIKDSPTLKDEFEKWKRGQAIRLSAPDSKNIQENDLSAFAWTAWNEKGFYLAAEVTDDIFSTPFTESGTAWANDSLQIAFDPFNDAKGNDPYKNDDHEYTVFLDKSGMPALHPDEDSNMIKFDIKRIDDKILYKVFFPWEALKPFDPEHCSNFGFNMTVMDNDGNVVKYPKCKGFHQWLQISNGICGGKRPADFRSIILQEPRHEKGH